MKTRIMVADDHPLIRAGIVAILRECPDMEVVAEAGSGSDALRKLAQRPVDVLVLDLKMDDGSGFDVLGQLSIWPTRPRVLVLSAHPEDQLALQVLRSGASGYLAKGAAPDELVRAIRKVMSGRKYLSEAVSEQLVETIDPRHPPSGHESLSPREMQVFLRLANGVPVSTLAEDLGISLSTAHTYRRRVLDKVGARGNTDLTRYALQHKLME